MYRYSNSEGFASHSEFLLFQSVSGEQEADWFKRLLFGSHWRSAWTTQVEVPYLDPDRIFRGLIPYKTGGGRQTLSLRFKARDGMRYVFRYVNKDPAMRLPYELRDTVVARVLRDQTTTQCPYGALVTDIIQNESGFLNPHPNLYVMPDDSKLGPFLETYGNMLGMLEEFPRDPDKVEKHYAADADEVLKSFELFNKLYRSYDKKLNARQLAKARIFDFLVGAWDRHEDNWKWAGYEEHGETVYEPIPRDSDNVFTLFDGILPWLFDRDGTLPMLETFDYHIMGLRGLTWQARYLGRFLISELDREECATGSV